MIDVTRDPGVRLVLDPGFTFLRFSGSWWITTGAYWPAHIRKLEHALLTCPRMVRQ